MYCNSLKRRPAFAPAVPILSLSSRLGLREHDLKTHDIALPLSDLHASRQLRLLLLSSADVAEARLAATVERIRHFGAIFHWQDIAVIFLLASSPSTGFLSARLLAANEIGTGQDNTEGVLAYAKLQAELMDQPDFPSLPIFLLPKLEDLSDLVKSNVAALTTQSHENPTLNPAHAFNLLQQCSAIPPMAENTTYYLSDVFPSLRDLALACTSVTSAPNSSSPSARTLPGEHSMSHTLINGCDLSDDGNAYSKLKQLRELVGDLECQNVVNFWKAEWTIE